jgi:beta-lactamase class A
VQPQLQSKLERIIASTAAAQVSLALHDLASGDEILIQPDIPYHPASTFKISVMMEAFHQASEGEYALEDPLQIKNEFSSIVDGSRFALSPADDSETSLYNSIGEQLSYLELIQRMIIYSSNLATNLLIEKVGAQRVTRFMQELGAPELLVRRGVEDKKAYALGLNNSATARSLMQVLTRLAAGSVVSPAASEEMRSILLQQHFNDGIPANLPLDTGVAHKTGWNENLYHDAAIVYPSTQAPYVLAIMTSGLPEMDEAPALVAGLSQIIFRSRYS